MLAWPLRILVRAYRWILSPLLPAACRFYPSCSVYAEEALAAHGFVRGGALMAWRLCRCHPFHPGGHDPVPPPHGRPARVDLALDEPAPSASTVVDPGSTPRGDRSGVAAGSSTLHQEDACAHC